LGQVPLFVHTSKFCYKSVG